MSLLADWFFTATMRLSPADSHAFLDTMTTLRRRGATVSELRDAVSALTTAPPWLQAYALRPLLAATRSIATHEEAPSPEDAELVRLVETVIRSTLTLTDHGLAYRLGGVLSSIARGSADAVTPLVDEIAATLATERQTARTPLLSAPYQELAEHIMPTLTVIAMAELTSRNPGSVGRDWLSDTATPLTAAALRGGYGRLALLAAADGACRTDPHAREVVWRDIWRAGGGAAHLQPDLLDALGRSWYGHPDGEGRPTVDALEQEAVTGADLALWRSQAGVDGTAVAEAYTLVTGRSAGSAPTLSAVLWNATVWALAAEVDPVDTADRLSRWWGIPERHPSGAAIEIHAGEDAEQAEGHVSVLAALRSGTPPTIGDQSVSETDSIDGAAVFSPWLNRWHDRWDHRRLKDPAFSTGQPEHLIRVLALAPLAVRLLESAPAVIGTGRYDHLIALVFHASDVLRDEALLLEALERGEYVGERRLGSSLTALLWHDHELLHEAGAGWLDRLSPAVLAAFAVRWLDDEVTADPGEGEQRARLARQGIGAICTMWINRAWVVSSGDTGPARWFVGDPPPALRVLFAALDRLTAVELNRRELNRRETARKKEIDREFARENPDPGKRKPSYGASLNRGLGVADLFPPAQLLREIYPQDWPEPVGERWPVIDVDWYAERVRLARAYRALLDDAGGDRDAVNTNAARPDRLLLSPLHPLAVWRQHVQDLDDWSRVQAAPMTMRVLRLAAVLREPPAATADPVYREWVEEWLDRLYAVNHAEQLPWSVRALMIGLIEPGPRGAAATDAEYARKLAEVHAASVDVILEFSGENLRHVELLLDRLLGDLPLSAERRALLQLRAVETVYRRRKYAAERSGLRSAFDQRLRRGVRLRLEQLLCRFLANVVQPGADTRDGPEIVPPAERVRRVWEQTTARDALRAIHTPLAVRKQAVAEGRDQVDGLRLLASVLDHYRAREVRYLLDATTTYTTRTEPPEKARDLFREATGHPSTPGTNTVIGIVAAVRTAHTPGQAPQQTVWVNCGIGALLSHSQPPTEAPFAEGDVIAVRLGGSPPTIENLTALDRAAPVAGEVRKAEVRQTVPWLSVSVDGVAGEAYPHPRDDSESAEVVRRFWDPDLARTFAEVTTAAPRTCLVRWDHGLGHWVPVTRRLAELIVDELAAAESVTLTYTALEAEGEQDWFFTGAPGTLYRLPPEVWVDPRPLAEFLRPESHGAVLTVTLASPGQPGLAYPVRPDGTPEYDDRNIRWSRYFLDHDNEMIVATRDDGGRHTVRIAPPPGFPETVETQGAEREKIRVHVLPLPWSDYQARLARVPVSPVDMRGVDDCESPSPERFEEMWDIRQGDVLVLDRLLSKNFNRMWAVTSTGLVVGLESESLTQLDLNSVSLLARRLVRGRAAEVVNDPRLEQASSYAGRPVLAIADFASRVHTSGVDLAAVHLALTTSTDLEGVIVVTLAEGRHYGTWCRFGAVAHYVELEPEWFGSTEPKLVGQPFTGRRTAEGWQLAFVNRRITVRALFELREGDPEPGEVGDYVGSAYGHDYHQLVGEPVLVRRSALTSKDDAVRLLGVDRAEVRVVNPKSTQSVRTVTVVTGRGGKGRTLLGGTRDSGPSTGVSVVGVELWVTTSAASTHDGRPYLKVRRLFTVDMGAQAPTRNDVDSRWQRFVQSRQEHVTGTLTADGDAIEVGGGLRPPGPDGLHTSRLPLVADQEPAVGGVHYQKNTARVRLVPDSNGFIGSYTAAEPLTLDDYARRYGRVSTGTQVALAEALYYVGPPTDELNAHVFEWGFGWTVAIPPHRLELPGAENAALPALFHGDRVNAVSFTAGQNRHESVMVIEQRDITHRYTRRVVDESLAHHLHLVDLEVQVDTGLVRVLRARASRSHSDTHDLVDGAQWVPFTAALDDASRDALVQSLRAAGRVGLVRQRVLARLQAEAAVSTAGRQRTFRAVRLSEEALAPNDYVFLTAQRIDATDNDLTVVFGMLEASNADDLVVRVNRREFSYRQSSLARLVSNGLEVSSGKIVLLVKLLSEKHGTWYGSVSRAPTRAAETLVSYLAGRGGAGYAIMGNNQLEIAPGVLFSARDTLGARGVLPGAVVRLTLDHERRVHLTTALPSDESYLTRHPRPAILFPKTPLLRGRHTAADGMARMFTVSGLPDAEVSPTDGAGAELLATPHPKVCLISTPKRHELIAEVASGAALRHAVVKRHNAQVAAGVQPRQRRADRGDGQGGIVDVAWARMSFADLSARDIAEMCRRNAWIHHDRVTGHVVNGRLVGPYEVPIGTATREGVFFDEDGGWTLRYSSSALERYGLPASVLVEDRSSWAGKARTFTVAGPNADNTGVWLEIGPGRVVEVRGALMATDEGTSLVDLDWSLFAAGDRVDLRLSRRSPGENWELGPNHLVLVSWRTTPRNALPTGDRHARLLLPVAGTDPDNGALLLGPGRQVVHPMALDTLPAYADLPAVWLDRRNDVEPAAYESLRPGDVVLLGIDADGALRIDGLPGVEVRLAGRSESLWPSYGWLRHSLEHAATRVPLINGLGGVLPVTIELINLSRSEVTVSRRNQPSGRWPANRKVRTEVVAAIGRDVLLRTGGAVYRVKVGAVVQGVPAASRERVSAAFAEASPSPTLYWQVGDDGEPNVGLADAEGTDPTVVAEFAVSDDAGQAAGVVCRDPRNARYYWLPVGHASWVPGVSAVSLLRNLRLIGKLSTRSLSSGAVSVTTHPAVAQQARVLRPSTPLRVLVGADRPVATDTGRWRYSARLEMPPVLLSYESTDPDLAVGASRFTEVDEVAVTGGRPSVTVVDISTRMVRPALPAWLMEGHAAIQAGGTPELGRFEEYACWYREGLPATGRPADPTEAVVRAAGTVIEGAAASDRDLVAGIALDWLAACGAEAANVAPAGDLDAAPLLSAVVVLDFLGENDGTAAAAAVALLHQTGRRAIASVHTEQFVMAWIARRDRHALHGAWARLRSLSLTAELTPRQVRQLRSFSEAMLVNPSLRIGERDLAPVARSLLAAVGELDSAADLLGEAEVLTPLATWGRTLVPPNGHATAQSRLVPVQRESLHLRTAHVVGEALPFTLMAATTPPGFAEAKFFKGLMPRPGG